MDVKQVLYVLGFGKLIFQFNKPLLWVWLSNRSFQASPQTWISLSSRDLNEILMMEDAAKLKVASLILFITNILMVRNLSGLGLDILHCPKKLYFRSFRDFALSFFFFFLILSVSWFIDPCISYAWKAWVIS